MTMVIAILGKCYKTALHAITYTARTSVYLELHLLIDSLGPVQNETLR